MVTLQTTVNTIDAWVKRHINRLLKQRWLDKGLRAKMSVLVTIGLLGLMTIFGVLSVTIARQATQQALNERLMLTRMSADTLDNLLLHIMDDIQVYAEISARIDFDVQKTGLSEISIFHQPIYRLDESGEAVPTSGVTIPPIPWHEVPSIQSALQGQGTMASAWPRYQPGTIVIATPIKDTSDRVTGALAAVLDISAFNIFPDKTNLNSSQTEVIDIIDQDGQIIFSNQENRLLEKNTEELILTQMFINQQGGVETCLGCSGTTPDELSDEVVSFAPLSSVPLGVVIRQPAPEVFASVRRLVIWHTLLGFVSIAGALGLVWATTKSVIDPLKTLKDAAQRIAQGDLSTPTGPLTAPWPSNRPRSDEIGNLGQSFDQMRRRLKASLDEIQTLNRELDARVQDRTGQAIAAQKEAQLARDDLQAIIDSLSDEMIVINVEDRRIVRVNQTCWEKNKNLGDITKLTCFELFHDGHPCDTPSAACPIDDVIETEEPVRVTHIRTGVDETEPVFLDIIASPLRDSSGKITRIVEMVRDITEERRISESLVRRNQQLAILNAITTTVSQSLDIKETLGLAIKEVIQRTRVEAGAVFLVEDVLGQLNLVAHFGLSDEAAQIIAQFGMLDGGCGGVMDHGQLVVVPDITDYRGKRARRLQNEKLTTLVHVPLTTKGRTLGSMCVGTRKYKDFGDSEKKMLMAIGRQIAVAIENARLYAELQQKEQVRRELFRKAINAQEDERKRIARELHDDTSQALTALMFAAEEGLGIDNTGEIKECLERMHSLTRQTLDGVHKLLFDLRPSMLDHLGLMPAIRWFAKSRLEQQGIRVAMSENDHSCRLMPEAEIALFRVAQEAITNIARHAGARNVRICCNLSDKQAQIDISDDGIGFDPSGITLSPETGQGLGLLGMSERLELVGGEFQITSTHGEGTRINISVPLSGNGRSEHYA